ncbi:MAG: hypothetical protein ABI920_01540 [Casimicrobiaceae bacterium]
MLRRLPGLVLGCGFLVAVAGPVWAAHPLATEDTGTQGRGHVEVEIGAQRVRTEAARLVELGLQATYGVTAAFDVLVRPVVLDVSRVGETTPARTRGAGDTDIGFKWRFSEADAGSVALRADLLLPTGDAGRGLGGGGAATRLVLIGSMDHGPWALHGNVGVLRVRPGSDTRRHQAFASTALVWSPREVLHISVELIASAEADRARRGWPLSSRFGAIVDVTPAIRLDAGLEQRLGAGSAQSIVLAGMTILW